MGVQGNTVTVAQNHDTVSFFSLLISAWLESLSILSECAVLEHKIFFPFLAGKQFVRKQLWNVQHYSQTV